MNTVTVSTKLLSAVARWAYQQDDRRHISCVIFRNREMVATDGHRLVRVPIDSGVDVAIRADHVQAAVAAQATLGCGELHDYDGNPAIELAVEGKWVRLKLGPLGVTVPVVDSPLEASAVETAMPKAGATQSPDGYVFNPAYLAAVDEIRRAAPGAAPHGVKILVWSDADNNGNRLGSMLFEVYGGIRCVIMPMHDTLEGAS